MRTRYEARLTDWILTKEDGQDVDYITVLDCAIRMQDADVTRQREALLTGPAQYIG